MATRNEAFIIEILDAQSSCSVPLVAGEKTLLRL